VTSLDRQKGSAQETLSTNWRGGQFLISGWRGKHLLCFLAEEQDRGLKPSKEEGPSRGEEGGGLPGENCRLQASPADYTVAMTTTETVLAQMQGLSAKEEDY